MRVLKVDERAGEVTVLMTLEEAHSLSVNVGGHPLYPERAERLEARLRSFHTDNLPTISAAHVPPTPTLADLARAKEEARRWDEELRRDRDADMAADEDSLSITYLKAGNRCGQSGFPLGVSPMTPVLQVSIDGQVWEDTVPGQRRPPERFLRWVRRSVSQSVGGAEVNLPPGFTMDPDKLSGHTITFSVTRPTEIGQVPCLRHCGLQEVAAEVLQPGEYVYTVADKGLRRTR
jgi:hypothetical protein